MSVLETPMSTMQPNTLMRTHVLSYLPTSRHLSLVCCAGSHGYGALKEMMDNGKVGHTLLLESDDLRDVEDSLSACCLLYTFNSDSTLCQPLPYSEHIPPTVSHIHVYWDMTSHPADLLEGCINLTMINLHLLSPVIRSNLYWSFLKGCTGLTTTVDLTPLVGWGEVVGSFLHGCTGLKTIDLSPLSQVAYIYASFLEGCTGLTSIDLTPLSQATGASSSFLKGCSGLKSIDLSPLRQWKGVYDSFLEGCSSLTSINLTPLSQITFISASFLKDCTGLTSIDLSPLAQVTMVGGSFLEGCTGLTAIDLGPLSQIRNIQDSFLAGCSGLRETLDMTPLTQLQAIRGPNFVGGCSSLKAIDMSSLTDLTKLPRDLVLSCGPNTQLLLPSQFDNIFKSVFN